MAKKADERLAFYLEKIKHENRLSRRPKPGVQEIETLMKERPRGSEGAHG
jgi:hypothetical protein